MVNAFPQSLLDPLIRLSLSSDSVIRRIVQEILHALLDRHENLARLKTIRYDCGVDLWSLGSMHICHLQIFYLDFYSCPIKFGYNFEFKMQD